MSPSSPRVNVTKHASTKSDGYRLLSIYRNYGTGYGYERSYTPID